MSNSDRQSTASVADRKTLDRLIDVIAQTIALRRQSRRPSHDAGKSQPKPPQPQR